jgi:hypothetical protein
MDEGALTDVDGKFEIKNLPVLGGQLRFFAFHEEAGQHGGPDGRYGKTIEVKPGTAELGEIKLDFKSKTDEKK